MLPRTSASGEKHCFHPAVLAVALFALVFSSVPADANTQPDAVVALHAGPLVSKAAFTCTSEAPTDPCSDYVTDAELNTSYTAYLVVAQADAGSGIAGLSCGIHYNALPGSGVDVFSWTLCADLEFPNSGFYGVWPNSLGGTRLFWNSEVTGEYL